MARPSTSKQDYSLLYCGGLELDPQYVWGVPVLEKAAALQQDHQLTVCRHHEQEIVQTGADSLILSTPIWFIRVQRTQSALYTVSSEGEGEGREISLERL